MTHVANASVAGGVVMGTACDMITNPGGAILCGIAAGALSCYSFTHLQPRLQRAGCQDACGVLSLHMLPGLMGGVVAAIAAAAIKPGPDWSAAAISAEARTTPGGAAFRAPRRAASLASAPAAPLPGPAAARSRPRGA